MLRGKLVEFGMSYNLKDTV